MARAQGIGGGEVKTLLYLLARQRIELRIQVFIDSTLSLAGVQLEHCLDVPILQWNDVGLMSTRYIAAPSL
jgi:hypothetical protein